MQLRTRTATGPPAQATRPPSAWGPRIACGLVAVVLLVGGLLLPLWETRLKAPQYPEGLRLTAYGAQVTGDVGEISNLNHYVGMRPFDPARVPEMQLWPLAMFVAFLAALVAIVGGRRLWARLARFYVWALPVGVLALIQFRLYQYGHDLDPKAALRIPEFTPKVVGPTKVWNFVTWSYPGLGLLCIALGAALLSFGPRLVDRLRRLILTAGAAVLVTALAAPVVGAQEVDDLAARIARAPEGSTLVVPGGSYHGNLVVDRPLVLQGRDRPLLHGHGTGTVLTITASDVVVRGFRVSGSGRDPTGEPAGIRIEGDRVTIEDTWIDDAYTGIAVVGAAETRLVGNHIRGRESAGVGDDAHVLGHHSSPPGIVRGDGISLWNAAGALVRDNTIDGVRDGVYTSFGSDILVDGNVVRESRYALHTMYSRDLSVAENRFERNLSGAVIMYGGGVLLLAP